MRGEEEKDEGGRQAKGGKGEEWVVYEKYMRKGNGEMLLLLRVDGWVDG